MKKKVDVKYIEIPNICFSLVDKDDSREERFKKQRVSRGFDDSETWSLTDTVANFIIPRLEVYRELANDDNNLEKKIDIFLQAMKLISRDQGVWIFNKKEEEIVNKGLKMFPEIFMKLWW